MRCGCLTEYMSQRGDRTRIASRPSTAITSAADARDVQVVPEVDHDAGLESEIISLLAVNAALRQRVASSEANCRCLQETLSNVTALMTRHGSVATSDVDLDDAITQLCDLTSVAKSLAPSSRRVIASGINDTFSIEHGMSQTQRWNRALRDVTAAIFELEGLLRRPPSETRETQTEPADSPQIETIVIDAIRRSQAEESGRRCDVLNAELHSLRQRLDTQEHEWRLRFAEQERILTDWQECFEVQKRQHIQDTERLQARATAAEVQLQVLTALQLS